jgi:hypothetical protein
MGEAMNEQEINIAIARANGWAPCTSAICNIYGPCGFWIKTTPDGESMLAVHGVPHYTTDLNLMHEAWCTLSIHQHQTYRTWLQRIVAEAIDLDKPKDGPAHSVCQATAAQRAEAYLQTLDLWQTNPPSQQNVIAAGR